MEISKDKALKENKGNFDAKLYLPNENIIDLTWWINNVKTALKSLTRQEPTMILKTDSSHHGWGGLWRILCYIQKAIGHMRNNSIISIIWSLKLHFCVLSIFAQ